MSEESAVVVRHPARNETLASAFWTCHASS
jgi:hypothetical protein